VKIYRERNGVQETIIPEIPESETYVEEVKEFLRCIKEGKEPAFGKCRKGIRGPAHPGGNLHLIS